MQPESGGLQVGVGDDEKNSLRVDAGLLALGGFDAVRLGRVLEVPILNLRVRKSDGTSVQ